MLCSRTTEVETGGVGMQLVSNPQLKIENDYNGLRGAIRVLR